MSLSISQRSELLVQSEIRNMSIECDKVNGINLSQGLGDLPVPQAVTQGVTEGMDKGINQYTRYDGLPELRQALAIKAEVYNKIKIDADKNIVVSSGATGAFYSACLALLNPGDEVIIFEPYYGYHINTLLAVGAVPCYVRLNPPSWSFNLEDLAQVITPKTKGIMISTPANPCGKVFSRVELEQLADFAIKHDLFVFTDEIYEYIIYDNQEHISPASLPQIFDRTITISGYSKTYSITGWRVGYCLCQEKWKEMIGYISDLVYVCAPAPLQYGVAKGIETIPDEFYKSLSAKYQGKRDHLCATLKVIGLTPYIPQGAYYVLADVSRVPGITSKDKAMYILEKTGVACVPGSAFFHDGAGDNLARFCFAKADDKLDEACERLQKLF